jgi:hypothetical protein
MKALASSVAVSAFAMMRIDLLMQCSCNLLPRSMETGK